MKPSGPNDIPKSGEEADAGITDNLALLDEHLPENSFARKLVKARRLAPEDPAALGNVIDERLEQLREIYAEAADQDD